MAVRGSDVISFTRPSEKDDDLADLRTRPPRSYPRGSGWRSVSPASCWRARRHRGPDAVDRLRHELRHGSAARVDPLTSADVALRDRIAAAPELLDSLAPAIGLILREGRDAAGKLATRPFTATARQPHLLVALAAAIDTP
jgi:hypothetical protein